MKGTRRDVLGHQGKDRRIIKMYLKEIGYEDVEWIQLAQYRVQWQTQ
jgi:hypothetical protein